MKQGLISIIIFMLVSKTKVESHGWQISVYFSFVKDVFLKNVVYLLGVPTVNCIQNIDGIPVIEECFFVQPSEKI